MKMLINLSKTLNVLLIICFFLPFMVDKCNEDSKQAETTASVNNQDSKEFEADTTGTSVIVEKNDSNANAEDTHSDTAETVTKSTTAKLWKKLIHPTETTISLFGYLVTYWLWLFIGIVAFIILFVFYLQFFQGKRLHLLVLLFIAELMLLSIPVAEGLNGLKIGYKLIFVIILLMLIVEFIILRKQKQ